MKNNILLIIILVLGIGLFGVYELKGMKQENNKNNFPNNSNTNPFPTINNNPSVNPIVNNPVNPAPIANPTSYQEALQISKQTGRHMVLMFSANWCTWCKKFKEETLPNSSVKTALNNYVFYIVDTDKDKATTSKFNVNKLPFFVIADSNENKLKINEGFLAPNDFTSWLNSVSPPQQPISPPVNPNDPGVGSGPGPSEDEDGDNGENRRRPGIIIRRPRNPGCPTCPQRYNEINGCSSGSCFGGSCSSGSCSSGGCSSSGWGYTRGGCSSGGCSSGWGYSRGGCSSGSCGS